MRDFFDLKKKAPQPLPSPKLEAEEKTYFVKRALAWGVDRSEPVRQAIFEWLLSFEGVILKKTFVNQLCRLEQDDEVALKQLSRSKGKRVIQLPPRQKPPKVELKNIAYELTQHNFVMIEGHSGAALINKFKSTLPDLGTYVLDMNELVLEYVDYQHRGRAGDIIEQASRADVLFIMGLEKPIALAYHIKDTLYQLVSVRAKQKDKYTVSTWNYTHEWYIPDYSKFFTHFSA